MVIVEKGFATTHIRILICEMRAQNNNNKLPMCAIHLSACVLVKQL